MYDIDKDPFEVRLKNLQNSLHTPQGTASVVIAVHEALTTAWASVRSVFGDKADPELAVELTRMMLTEERRQSSPSQSKQQPPPRENPREWLRRYKQKQAQLLARTENKKTTDCSTSR